MMVAGRAARRVGWGSRVRSSSDFEAMQRGFGARFMSLNRGGRWGRREKMVDPGPKNLREVEVRQQRSHAPDKIPVVSVSGGYTAALLLPLLLLLASCSKRGGMKGVQEPPTVVANPPSKQALTLSSLLLVLMACRRGSLFARCTKWMTVPANSTS